MTDSRQYAGLETQEIVDALQAAPLNTKKNVLTFIDTIKKLSKTELTPEQLTGMYAFIDGKIDEMGDGIKVNTLAYLKNELRNKLGKYAGTRHHEEGAFLKFYKEAFKNSVKTKEYTWAMIDISKIQDTSVLETLKVINTYALKTKLTQEEKADILPMIKRMVDTQNVRLINQVRSMEGLRKAFRIKIIEKDKRFMMITI